MTRRAIPLFIVALGLVVAAIAATAGSAVAQLVGVSEVSASKPSFSSNETITITVVATDDDGMLRISSSLPGSKLNVTGCDNIGSKVAGRCDSGGMASVTGQNTRDIFIDTATLDSDTSPEQDLTVTLTLQASCPTAAAVTIDADQPENAGPDAVTINCNPPTPTPTPTFTPTSTFTPVPTSTPLPTSTPPAVPPTSTPFSQVLSSGITPPSTGDAGLR